MKKLQKTAAAALFLSAAVAGTTPASAAESKSIQQAVDTRSQQPQVPANVIQEAQAVSMVRGMFDGLSGLPFVHASYQERGFRSQSPVWFLSFSKQDPKNTVVNPDDPPMETFHAELDARTGDLLTFNHQHPDWMGSKNPPEEIARQAANEFLKKLDPKLYSRVQLDTVSGGGGSSASTRNGKTYTWSHSSIMFNELVNGIPFKSNRVQIDVDEYGHVFGMYRAFRFDSSKLPDSAKALPVEKVQQFAKQLDMQKYYVTRFPVKDKDGKMQWIESPKLVYGPKQIPVFDAVTGQSLTEDYYYASNQERKSIEVTGSAQPLIAKDKQDAKLLVAELLKIDLSTLQFREEQRPPVFSEKELWSFSWMEKPDPNNPQPLFINAAFDAQTGQLLSIHMNGKKDSGKKAAFTLQEGQAKALAVLQKQLPLGKQELFLMSSFDRSQPFPVPKWFDPSKQKGQYFHPENIYTYYFVAGHQGVPVVDQGYSVELDSATGELVGLSLSATAKATLPDNKNTVSPEAAKQTFLQEHPLKLAYYWPEFFMQMAPEGQLRYEVDALQKFAYIDAFTGKTIVVDNN